MKKNLHSSNLVEMWGDFIDWEARRKGENGFLENTLRENKCTKIFDSTLGDGCDSVHLIKKGFDVTSNEVDSNFLAKAIQNSKNHNVKLKVTEHDWRNVSEHLGINVFDAVLCLGNSIAYLFKKNDRLKSIKEFFRILKPGGILIIDERNHRYLLNNREEILNGNFKYKGKYVYCGKHVKGFPIEISDDLFKMKYVDNRNGKFASLDIYPYKENELENELKNAGFADITLFADYSKTPEGTPDFFQYIAKK
ncbi:MAG: methyltransferase domain-containing protein [Candidatus Diapherotrites archaeon]